MRAEYCEDGAIVISGAMRQERFRKIVAGIGWPDTEPGHLCVVADRPDGRYHALWEHSGGLTELGDAAIESKDRFLAERIYVDSGDEVATSYLRTLDGLCFYADRDREVAAKADDPKAARPWWPHFRDWATTSAVVPVPNRIVTNYRSALEKTRGVIISGKLLIHESQCRKLVYTLRQPLDQLLKSPVIKALVWAVATLEEAAGNGIHADTQCAPWYVNRGRDRV